MRVPPALALLSCFLAGLFLVGSIAPAVHAAAAPLTGPVASQEAGTSMPSAIGADTLEVLRAATRLQSAQLGIPFMPAPALAAYSTPSQALGALADLYGVDLSPRTKQTDRKSTR